ncbi:unnamed protein product [Oncorhynchus mykiss]|uniref:VWFA domain-containing protein n=1 Tax=Oncorhynchus mykiss TaxID=8022 RepID=A0A060X545_ONCMY|nr:unnamed protein product [Oncorhynchus mykiss]
MRQLCVCVSVLLALATMAVARPKEGPEQKCKSGPVDLMFIIDSSRSVRPHEFESMRKFMIDIIHTLDMEANATRVGVVQYSSQVQNEFSLKTHGKLQGMVKGINEIVPLAQGTMTGLAIKYVMNHAFTAAEGDRPKVPNVAVIVTDGRPQDRVAEVAAEARDKGIEIYAVGVARADMTSLRAMASPPIEDHVFLVESFDLIYQFGLQFQDKLCGMDLCLESDHGCEHLCESSPRSFHCLCLPGYTLNEDGNTCKVTSIRYQTDQVKAMSWKEQVFLIFCILSIYVITNLTATVIFVSLYDTAIDPCAGGKHDCEQICIPSPGAFTCGCNTGYTLNDDKKTCTRACYCMKRALITPMSYPACRSANIDLVLLIDGSKSVRPQNFELVKQFVNQVVDSLDVSAHGTRVGLVQYSSHVRTEFALKMYEKADDIKKAVMNVEYMEKGTMTGLALKHMMENSFSEAEGARKNIPRVGLVFTDGRSQDDITEWAKKAKEEGITMYAVGVGKAVEDELREIASEPLDKHFFYTTDFTFINQIAENLKLNVCAEESQGELEVKDPCACESLVEFQQATMSTLEQLKTKHILLYTALVH